MARSGGYVSVPACIPCIAVETVALRLQPMLLQLGQSSANIAAKEGGEVESNIAVPIAKPSCPALSLCIVEKTKSRRYFLTDSLKITRSLHV